MNYLLCWTSGHKPPRTIYYRETAEGYPACTENRAEAKRFQSKSAALSCWRHMHQWPEDYEECLIRGTTRVQEESVLEFNLA